MKLQNPFSPTLEHRLSSTLVDDVWQPHIVAHINDHRARFANAVATAQLYSLLWVKIKIVDGCNIRCVMCNHWRRKGYLRNELTTERLLSLSSELVRLRTQHVNWAGGEPTLRTDLPRIIERLSSDGIRSSIITNGTRLTQKYAACLRGAGLSCAIVSLESSDPGKHDSIVGHQGAWRKLVDGVGFLHQANSTQPLTVIANTVLTSINTGDDLLDLVRLAASLGISRINFSCVYTAHLTSAEQRSLPPSQEQVNLFRTAYLPSLLRLGQELGVAIIVNGDTTPPPSYLVPVNSLVGRGHVMGYYQHPDRSCYLPFYHCTIDYNGNVVACCHMRDGTGLLGNILTASLADILGSERAATLRRKLTTADMPPQCSDCAMQTNENTAIDRLLATLGNH